MPVPFNFRSFQRRLGRFLSKDETEAENPASTQIEDNIQVIGDYSGSPVSFYIKPPATLIYELRQVNIRITDNNPISPENYVSGGPLTNGINYEIRNNGTVAVANTIPIKRISDYISYVGTNVSPIDYVTNPNSYAINWDLVVVGAPLFLDGRRQESLHVVVNDDFTSLIGHTARVRGIYHFTDVYKP